MNKILVVDDSPTIRNTFEWLLCNEGYQVWVAEDSLMALTLFTSFKPDLMIVDIVMPNVNGIMLCETIRQQSTIPILIISGRSGTLERQRALEAGATDFLVKPIKDDTLLKMTAQYLCAMEKKFPY